MEPSVVRVEIGEGGLLDLDTTQAERPGTDGWEEHGGNGGSGTAAGRGHPERDACASAAPTHGLNFVPAEAGRPCRSDAHASPADLYTVP